ncbi:MAG: PLP-dependent aminotransferase family protein, partial [Ruminococcus sp.]
EYLLGMLVQLLGASRRYAAEEPGYPKGKQILRSNGASVVPVPMDADGLDPERLLRSGASVALVTPSHQFPTGKVMPLRRRARLLEWTSQAPDRWLIEDDYDTELRFHGKPLPALFSLDRNAHVIYLNTFARTLAPSLRIGYVVLPPTLAKRFQKEFSFYSCSVPSFEQYTLVQFLKKGCLERHLHRMKRTYQERQTLLTQQLRSHPFATHLTILGEEAGLHLLLQVDLPCTESTLVHEAENAHVSVYALSAYCEIPNQKSERLPCIVMGYACLSPDEIKAGTKRLLDAWQRLSETLT